MPQTFTPAHVELTINLVKVLSCARGGDVFKCGSFRGKLKRDGAYQRRGFNREVGLKRAFTVTDLLVILQKSLDRALFLNIFACEV